ncbi:MAG: V-type ATPase 116kDa subunit family protein, partial [Candidatus Bathyarchaeota archaeon]
KITKKLENIAKNASIIYAHKEIVDIELRIEDLKKKFRQTSKTNVLELWVKETDFKKTVAGIKEKCPTAIIRTGGEEKGDKPPTFMRNPIRSDCYEKLVRAYGLPNYRELDPTIIMFISFPIIFGLMFADIGHGLILLIGGLVVNQVFDKFNIKGGFWHYLQEARVLIIGCGIAAIFFGFLFGDFFGATYAANIHTPNWYTMITGISSPPWFSPFDFPSGPIRLLKIAIIIGIMHITFGIVISLYNKLRNKKYRESIAPASWLWFYGSLSYLILNWGLRIGEVILNPTILMGLLIIPFIGMIVLHWVSGKTFMDAFSEGVTKGIESLSNTVSYGRIMALGMVHAVFSEMAIMGQGPMQMGTMLIVTLFLILALEGILTFAHTLRLHWVEWFSKFYEGDGIPFEDFTIRRRFTKVV